MATCRSTFHSTAVRITASVRITIEMTYRRCLPRTSSARALPGSSDPENLRRTVVALLPHHIPPPASSPDSPRPGPASTLRPGCADYETGARLTRAYGLRRTAYGVPDMRRTGYGPRLIARARRTSRTSAPHEEATS